MAIYYTVDDKRRLEYDLSTVEVGESILSDENDKRYLCVRLDDKWRIFEYGDGRITRFETLFPQCYIHPYNEIFDKEKTEWVQRMFNDAITAQQQLEEFQRHVDIKFAY